MNLSKTIIQMIVFWTTFLYIIPNLILPFDSFKFAGSSVGLVLFVFGSCLGAVSAFLVALKGDGTPLPLDPARKLIVCGPYKYVRNPMAVGGISQGVAVGVYHGSPLVILYAISGAVIWQYLIRPWEEKDLEDRFGKSYIEYKSRVRCWVPMINPRG